MKESKQPSKTLRGYLIHINDGVAYHRHIASIKSLKKLGWKFKYPPFDFNKTDMSKQKDDDLHPIMKETDILITQRNDIDRYIATSQLMQAGYKIPWVYDTDDDVHAVRPSNPGFGSYNINSPHMKWALMAIEKAFALTVSTKTLKDIYSKNNKRIYVLPNGVDLARWDKYPRGKKPKNEIRLGLLVSANHWENIKMIEDVLLEITKAYPNVVLYVYRGYKLAFLKKISKKQIVWPDWAKGEDWPKNCKKLALDIGLAPLADNNFNRSKSNLRWLENTAQGIPTIASDTLPYRTANDDAIILCKTEAQWFDAISLLIEDEKLRRDIVQKARKQVEKEYDIHVVAKIYDEVYRKIIKDFKEIYGEPHREDFYRGVNHKSIEDSIRAIAEDIQGENIRGEKRKK